MQISDNSSFTKQRLIKVAYATCFNRVNKAGFVQVLNMCNGLSANGVELKLFAGFINQKMDSEGKQILSQFMSISNGLWNFRQQSYPNNFYVNRLPNSLVTLLRHSSHAMAVLRAKLWNPDILYTREYAHAALATFLKIPVFLEIHEANTPHMPFNKLKSLARLTLNKKFFAVSPTTQKLADDLIEAGVPKTKLIVLPNAAPSSATYSMSKEEARAKLNIDFSSKMVTYTGHLYEGKGVNDLINVALKLPHFQIYIVGGGLGLSTAKSLATSIGASNIKFIGIVPPAQIPLFQLASDVLVATLHDEIFQCPIKVAEYAAAQRPMVVTDLSPMRNRLTDQADALFYKLGDANDLADKINMLINTPHLAKSLSDNAYERIGKWTWEDRAATALNLIQSKLKYET